MNNSFRLKLLKLSGHPVLKEINLSFCNDCADYGNTVYFTGIIGANGTGKSYLMAAIADVFIEIATAMNNNYIGQKRFSFTIEYQYSNEEYFLTNVHRYRKNSFYDSVNHNYIIAKRNGQEINLNDVFLPSRVIVSTMTVTDRFRAVSDSFYRYKGIRNEHSVNTTGTRTLIRKTVASLMDCMATKGEFQYELRTLLNKLGFKESLTIKYGMRYKDIFLKNNISSEMILDIFSNWKVNFPNRQTPPWGYRNFKTISENKQQLNSVASFLSRVASNNRYNDSVIISYDVINCAEEFKRDADVLKILTQLDIVSFPSIEVNKCGTSYLFENNSSGETHLLCQLIGIMADIRHTSLVLIDEPENSSHPEWQMNYVGWLKEIFKTYSDCHFIIATHSPLILSNFKPSESTIVRLVRTGNGHIYDDGGMQNGCYSWTIDEILQDVMTLKSTRTAEFDQIMSNFENALKEDNYNTALASYNSLLQMIRPGNVLAELLRIQMIGLSKYDKDTKN